MVIVRAKILYIGSPGPIYRDSLNIYKRGDPWVCDIGLLLRWQCCCSCQFLGLNAHDLSDPVYSVSNDLTSCYVIPTISAVPTHFTVEIYHCKRNNLLLQWLLPSTMESSVVLTLMR